MFLRKLQFRMKSTFHLRHIVSNIRAIGDEYSYSELPSCEEYDTEMLPALKTATSRQRVDFENRQIQRALVPLR
ncbi:hypothetical protein TNCV_3139781 [Trichonephila clavipes]|nr:hypothetical protein TNCV_3139781 [Trichonephila clavipes]